ncbi:MAG: hypothetical protein WD512_12880 [Candidatus Paceibacterota bacterium]
MTAKDKILENLSDEYKEFFKNSNSNAIESEVDVQSKRMADFVISLYQTYNYNLIQMFKDNAFVNLDKEKKDQIFNHTKLMIDQYILPNMEIIYANTKPENETMFLTKVITNDTAPSIPSTTTSIPSEEIDIKTKRRIKYAALLKPVTEKIGKVEDAADMVCDMMRDYKSNGFDKEKTLKNKLEFFPEDIQNQFKSLYEKLLNDLDEWIYLFTPPKIELDDRKLYDLLNETKNYVNDSQLTDEARAKQGYARMVHFMVIAFKGDKDMARDYVNWLIQMYEELDRSKFTIIKRVQELMVEYDLPMENRKIFETRNGHLIEMIDRYLMLTKSGKKDINHDQYKDNGYISDDEENEKLPKIDNSNFWTNYVESVATCYPEDKIKDLHRQMISTGKSGDTIIPSNSEYHDESSIFMRRMKAKSTGATMHNYYGGTSGYEPPDSPRTRMIKSFKITMDKLNVNAGVTTNEPMNKVRKISKKLAEMNKEYLPIVLSLSELANNIIKLYDMMNDTLNKMKNIIPEKYQYQYQKNEENGPEGLTVKEETDLILSKMELINKWINDIEHNRVESPDDGIELVRYVYQLIRIYRRMDSVVIFRNPKKSKESTQFDKNDTYYCVMQPYNYCYHCKEFKMELELTNKNGFFSPVICGKCKTEIYHLNKKLLFKWNDKEKLPYLEEHNDVTVKDTGFKNINFENGDVIDMQEFKTAIFNKMEIDPTFISSPTIKMSDLNIIITPPPISPLPTPTTPIIPEPPPSAMKTYPPNPVETSAYYSLYD